MAFRASLAYSLLSLLLLSSASARQAPKKGEDEGGQDLFEITVAAEGRAPYRIAVPAAYGNDPSAQKSVREIAVNNLRIATAFKVLKESTYPNILKTEEMTLKVDAWRRIGAQGVLKMKVHVAGSVVTLEFKLWEMVKGADPVLTKTTRTQKSLLRMAIHTFCNEVMKYYTKEPGAFGTHMAFVATLSSKRKDIYIMQHDGFGLTRVSKPKSINILPTWSPNGNLLLYTSYMRRNPDLYLVRLWGLPVPRRVSKRQGLNAGAAYSPDGKKVAITLTRDGNPEIYLLSARRFSGEGMKVTRRLTNHAGIDTSPTWSPDGRKIVWVSNRYGNPQLWIMNSDGTKKRRLTRRGYYNQTPAWCPQKGSNLVAFTSRKSGRFSVFTYNVRTGAYRRITGRRHGNNEEPTWAPNCQLLAFASSRGGIWVSNQDGTAQTQIYKGKALQPRWGPWSTLR